MEQRHTPKKIAFFSFVHMEFGGGLEKYFIETSSTLANLPDTEADIICLSDELMFHLGSIELLSRFQLPKRPEYRETTESVQKRLGRSGYYRCPSIRDLKRKLRAYDVIYSRNEIMEGIIFKILLGYGELPPVIFGCHTPIRYPNADSLQAKFHNLMYCGFIYKYLTSGVSKFHVINKADEAQLKEMLPNKEVLRIPNPFDFEGFREKAKQEKINDIDSDRINIIWVGQLTGQKGVRDLIRVIDTVNESDKDYVTKVAWHIAGEGIERPAIQELAHRWSNVIYHGQIPNALMPSLYSQCSFMISTSKSEGFPYTLLEAQAMRLPVIAYDISGNSEIIKNGINGYLEKDIDTLLKQIKELIENSNAKLQLDYAEKLYDRKAIYGQLTGMLTKPKPSFTQ